MKRLSSPASVRQQLLDGIRKGYWTLEDLDTPPPGFIGDPANYRNLLRDRSQPHPEAVQPTSDRDLPPLPHGVTPAQQPDLPVTLEEPDPLPW